MKKVTCKNCGATYDENIEYCPYCQTMNKKGAYKGFRMRFSQMIDRMLGLKQEAEKSVSQMIVSALSRSLIIIAVIVLAAYLCALRVNVNYYNNYEYDSKTLENIEWYDANIDKLEEAFANNDLKAIKKMYYENSSVVSKWPHYPDFVLAEEYEQISSFKYFDSSKLQTMLYYMYWPEYYTGRNSMKTADMERYQAQRRQVLESLEARGYSEQELQNIYQQCTDANGYLDVKALEKYVKGD